MEDFLLFFFYLRENNRTTLRLKQIFILHHLYYFLGKFLHCQLQFQHVLLLISQSTKFDTHKNTKRETDLERLIFCPEAYPWNILQPHWKSSNKTG